MPGIWNINSIYDANTKKIFKKLSFEVGESFFAKVVNSDKLTGEIILKLLDGWQFPAKLEKPLENLKEGLIRFQVQGFEDGKLNLKILNIDNKKEDTDSDSINSFLSKENIDVSKEDYELLNKMVKHEIPLTRENISELKTLVNFTNKIKNNDENEDSFILKYMQSRNIDINTRKGNEIKNTLKSFFDELKNLTEDDFLTILENNIDLTEGNIRSFNNVFKKSLTIYNDIKNLGKEITKDTKEIPENLKIYQSLDEKNTSKNNVSERVTDNKFNDLNGHKKQQITEVDDNFIELNKNNDIKIEVQPENVGNKELIANSKDNFSNKAKDVLDKNLDEINLSNNEENNKLFDSLLKNNKSNDVKHYSTEDISKNIKEQINIKTDELKDIIKAVLEEKNDKNSKTYNNIIQVLDKSINDFKVFNLVSGQYYYLDIPINLSKNQYECKLIIKDDRKKGKKIDTTNIKIAASVNTINMGTVDAYIKLNNGNMDIDIKCNKEWIKILDIGKEKVLNEISNMGYNVCVKVDERKKEMNIINCREFFEDNNTGMIDTKV